MKRPFAVIGFSMLVSTLVFYNIDFKTSVALTVSVAVIFCLVLLIKPLRKAELLIGILSGILIFSIAFTNCQASYIQAANEQDKPLKIHGVVCQTPTHTDYNHIYIIKLFDNDYKIRYITQENRFFEEGEVVKGTLVNSDGNEIETDYLENSLSSKIYFSYFETDNYKLESTGVYDEFYKNLGKIKNAFTNLTYKYLPSENGGIANAIVIGDRQGISNATMEIFNYAGTSHLLVVSGMHLSIWGFGIIKLLRKHWFFRKYSTPISIIILLLYSALTGFSVSVVRAFVMVGALILGRVIKRDADVFNSIGLGCAVILIANPFSAYSVALWLTVLSTLGILVLTEPIKKWIYNTYWGNKLSSFWIFRFVINAFTVTVGATICTLPVYAMAFDIFPWASFMANIVTVDAATMIMLTTIIGAVFHCLGLYPFAQLSYTISGLLSNFITICAKEIGLAKWSSISTSHIAFKYFIAFAIITVLIAYILRKKIKGIIKITSVILSFVFITISIATVTYDYRTPSVEFYMDSENAPIIHANYKGESVIIITNTVSPEFIKSALNRHNLKIPEQLVILETDDSTFTDILYFKETFYCSNVAFADCGISTFDDEKTNINKITLSGKFEIIFSEDRKSIEFIYNNQRALFIFGSSDENVFKNPKLYDIIIVYDQLSVNKEFDYVKISDGETVYIEF